MSGNSHPKRQSSRTASRPCPLRTASGLALLCGALLLTSCSNSHKSTSDLKLTPDAGPDAGHGPDFSPKPDDVSVDHVPADIVPADLPRRSDQPGLSDAAGEAADADIGHDSADQVLPDVQHEVVSLKEIWPAGTVLKECSGGLLAVVPSPSGDIRIMVVRGSHHEIGLQTGCLVGADVGQFFGSFMAYFLDAVEEAAEEMGMDPEQTSGLLFSMLSNIWLHMEPFVPQKYKEEMDAFEEAVLGDPDIAQYWTENPPSEAVRALLLLSNLSDLNWSGSIEIVLEKLSKGASEPLLAYYDADTAGLLLHRVLDRFRLSAPLPLKTSCSFFAAFGERTEGNHLLASRNLDWSTNTGISVLKGITVYAPDGEFMHATIGYLGFIGALAGISERGLVVSEVGSESVMERLKGMPWTLKFREILETAGSFDQAVKLATGTADDGVPRPPTIGYNFLIGFGDPPTGAGAAAAALETNGAAAGILAIAPGCQPESRLVQYDADGNVAGVLEHDDSPLVANLEAEAVEIDSEGVPRLFLVDENGQFILDESGFPTPAADGKPFPVGKPLLCALYRGDEALMHGIRRWQLASHGPQGGDSLLYTSGSYRKRYLVMHDMLEAFEKGTAYSHEGVELIQETGEKTLLGLPEAEKIARAAAMGSNVMGIVYDGTALKIRVSYEIEGADSWEAAHKHEYLELDIKAIFDAVKTSSN